MKTNSWILVATLLIFFACTKDMTWASSCDVPAKKALQKTEGL